MCSVCVGGGKAKGRKAKGWGTHVKCLRGRNGKRARAGRQWQAGRYRGGSLGRSQIRSLPEPLLPFLGAVRRKMPFSSLPVGRGSLPTTYPLPLSPTTSPGNVTTMCVKQGISQGRDRRRKRLLCNVSVQAGGGRWQARPVQTAKDGRQGGRIPPASLPPLQHVWQVRQNWRDQLRVCHVPV